MKSGQHSSLTSVRPSSSARPPSLPARPPSACRADSPPPASPSRRRPAGRQVGRRPTDRPTNSNIAASDTATNQAVHPSTILYNISDYITNDIIPIYYLILAVSFIFLHPCLPLLPYFPFFFSSYTLSFPIFTITYIFISSSLPLYT